MSDSKVHFFAYRKRVSLCGRATWDETEGFDADEIRHSGECRICSRLLAEPPALAVDEP